MKKMNFLEINGLVLIVIGFILMILNGRIEDSFFSKVAGRYELFYWGGIVIWAAGYMIKQGKKKKQK
ncbi:hypothetical protein [Maribacter sp. 2307ULW6-5]|uniref:hypothetical protein n=1 Tax=Maribacter sp. 2307ULW6-5 TaxID=3386275 RepID=UPI0039BC9151